MNKTIIIIIIVLLFTLCANARAKDENTQEHEQKAISALLSKLESKDVDEREAAAKSLIQMGGKAAPQIAELMAQSYYSKQGIYNDILLKMGKTAVPALISMLKYNEGREPFRGRTAAAFLLGEIKDESAVLPLIEALTDQENSKPKSNSFCFVAAEALGKIKDGRAFAPLIKLLQTPDFIERRGVVRALGLLGDKRAVEILIDALQDADPGVRGEAKTALGLLKDARAIEPLMRIVETEWTRYCSAIPPLKEITGLDLGMSQQKWIDWWKKECEKEEQIQNADELSQDEKQIMSLIVDLGNKDYKVFSKARKALSQIGKPAVERLLSVLNNSKRWELRSGAAIVLGDIKDERTIQPLIDASSDWSLEVRTSIISALTKFGDSAVPKLSDAINNDSWKIRCNAVIVLGNIGNRSALKALQKALEDENNEVKIYAAKAIDKFKK